jgi:hypothetical protein
VFFLKIKFIFYTVIAVTLLTPKAWLDNLFIDSKRRQYKQSSSMTEMDALSMRQKSRWRILLLEVL